MGTGRRRPRSLHRKLLAIRKKLDVSQTEMARLLDLDVAYTAISGYELGTRQPDLLVLLRYARLAEVSTDVLIDDKLRLPG